MSQSDEQLNARDRRGERKAKKAAPKQWKGFVSCNLSTADKEQIKELMSEGELQVADLYVLVEERYKLSITKDGDTNTYTVSLTDNDVQSAACGYSLTGRGSTIEKAAASLLYKHHYLLRDGWETAQTAGLDMD